MVTAIHKVNLVISLVCYFVCFAITTAFAHVLILISAIEYCLQFCVLITSRCYKHIIIGHFSNGTVFGVAYEFIS